MTTRMCGCRKQETLLLIKRREIGEAKQVFTANQYVYFNNGSNDCVYSKGLVVTTRVVVSSTWPFKHLVLNFWPTAISVNFGVFFIRSRQLLANMLCVASCTPPAQHQPANGLISREQTRAKYRVNIRLESIIQAQANATIASCILACRYTYTSFITPA